MRRAVWLVLLVWSISTAKAGGADWFFGATNGERLQYKLYWMGVLSGESTLQMVHNHRGVYTIQTTLATLGAARLVRAIDEHLTAKGQRLGTHWAGQRYAKEQKRTNHTKWTTYQFDWPMREVVRTRRVQGERREETTLSIPLDREESTDPLSGFFAMRTWPDLLPGRVLERVVVEGEKVYCLTISVGGSHQLSTRFGEMAAFPVQVTVSNSEMFRDRPVVIWLTDDKRRMPVKVEAQLSFGSVVAELVGFEDGLGESRSVE